MGKSGDPRKASPDPKSGGSARASGPRGWRPSGGTTPTVGRRASRPGFLLAVGLMWIAMGVVAGFSLTASWKLVVVIVFIGIGLLYLRSAGLQFLRQTGRS